MSEAHRAAVWLCFAGLVLMSCGSDQPSVVRGGQPGLQTAAGSGGLRPAAVGGQNVSPPPGGPLLAPPSGLAAIRSGAAGQVCASAVVQTMKATPTVMFVIDGSGSMCAPYGAGGTRWQALRSALLDPAQGLIFRLQESVKFGALLYDGTVDLVLALAGQTSPEQNPQCALQAAMNKMTGMCPELLETPAALQNAMAIDAMYPTAELGGSTPTDRALDHLMDTLIPMVGAPSPDGEPPGDIYVILATDGAPNDICVGGVGGDGAAQRQGVINAVQRGADVGITTWVISLAGGDPGLQAHLDQVAVVGAPNDPAAHTFNPNNPEELIQTLAQLLGGAVGCNISLNGSVTVGQECLGTVEQSGQALPCCQSDAQGAWTCSGAPTPNPNGWHLTDPGSIELVGDACTQFLLGASDLVSATFPCEVFSPN